MLNDTVAMVLAGLVAVMLGLAWLARRFPDVAWLQHFRGAIPELSPELRARLAERQRQGRRRSDFYAGAQLILLGIALPIGYLGLSVMTFSDPTRTEMLWVGAGSLACIALGVTAIWTSRRR